VRFSPGSDARLERLQLEALKPKTSPKTGEHYTITRATVCFLNYGRFAPPLKKLRTTAKTVGRHVARLRRLTVFAVFSNFSLVPRGEASRLRAIRQKTKRLLVIWAAATSKSFYYFQYPERFLMSLVTWSIIVDHENLPMFISALCGN